MLCFLQPTTEAQECQLCGAAAAVLVSAEQRLLTNRREQWHSKSVAVEFLSM